MKHEVINTTERLNDLKDRWTELLDMNPHRELFQTWEWNSLWWGRFGKGQALHIVTIYDDDNRLVGIAPLYIAQKDSRALMFIGGEDLTDYLDFIVAPGREAVFFTLFLQYVQQARQAFDRVDLQFIPQTSKTLGILTSMDSRIQAARQEVAPQIDLGDTWDRYLAGLSSKNRHEMKRKMNKAARELGATMITPSGDDMPVALESFFTLHKKSRTEKDVFMRQSHVSFFTELAAAFGERGFFELPLLVYQGAAIAALFCFLYCDRVYIYNSGFNPEYSQWAPGIVLISLYIRESIQKGFKTFDFLRGGESYKYAFGARDRLLYRIKLNHAAP
jgi:CelD/BcsL family acetyltransferase involved in cellulose biosynthesis